MIGIERGARQDFPAFVRPAPPRAEPRPRKGALSSNQLLTTGAYHQNVRRAWSQAGARHAGRAAGERLKDFHG